MLRKLIALFLLISSFTIAQNTVKGYISPNLKSDWLILYRLEGTRQIFVNNTTIKKDSLYINNKIQAVGSFEITLPKNAKIGSYRATYRLEGAGFVDFFYNKEDVEFIFNPDFPQQSIAFTKSKENKLYKQYLDDITVVQEKIDSIQVAFLQNKKVKLDSAYKKAYTAFNKVQSKYESESKNMLIHDFITASPRVNSETILNTPVEYLGLIKSTFFDKLDFTNKQLVNSSFLTNRILDYIFYINYADNAKEQQTLYKKTITKVLSKIDSKSYKSKIIEFLIGQFETQNNIEIIDYLFNEHYNKLPINLQNQQFKKEKEALFAAEIGRIAPDFSWSKNGQNFKLSKLNDAEKYVLVFWSTSCSHCLREIPQLHSFMKSKSNIKVVAFALEKEAFVWQQFTKANLQGWHNVLGLNKWENKTARTYNINATPSYFVLDKNKKIIAKPNEFKDVKEFINKL
jgi:thiol-disulfide isomerase/thioredoxin